MLPSLGIFPVTNAAFLSFFFLILVNSFFKTFPSPCSLASQSDDNCFEVRFCCYCCCCFFEFVFYCVSCRAKSSLCRQPFKSVQKSGGINLKKTRFFPVLDRFRALREFVAIFFIRAKLAPFDDESRDEFHGCAIES